MTRLVEIVTKGLLIWCLVMVVIGIIVLLLNAALAKDTLLWGFTLVVAVPATFGVTMMLWAVRNWDTVLLR